ncbi:MAG: DUF6174 domain-containing protein [Solirubrobacteraceae bacterium]
MIRFAVLVLALLAASAVAAPMTAAGQRTELAHSQAVWAAQHVASYTFRLRVFCFCPDRGRPATITVRHGWPRGGRGFQTRLDTIPKLFAEIHRALATGSAGPTTVRYDGRRGFPRTASIDPIKNAIDDEFGWIVDRFRPL